MLKIRLAPGAGYADPPEAGPRRNPTLAPYQFLQRPVLLNAQRADRCEVSDLMSGHQIGAISNRESRSFVTFSRSYSLYVSAQ